MKTFIFFFLKGEGTTNQDYGPIYAYYDLLDWG